MIKLFKSVFNATIKLTSVLFATVLSSVFVYFMMNTLSEILNNQYLISNALALTPFFYLAYILMLAKYFGRKNEIKNN